MKKISKVISVVLTALLIMSQMCCVAFADEQATVGITSNVDGLTMITNQIATDGTHTDVEGTYVQGGVITYTFDTAMDTDTLTPENIIITLETKNSAGTSLSVPTPAVVANCDITNPGEATCVYKWKYQPYQVTSTSYSISIADMVEGLMLHKVTFTGNVKTADGKSIQQVEKEFTTGRIATTKGYEGKALRNVAFEKNYVTSSGGTSSAMTDFVGTFENTYKALLNDWIKIDLGNYYDIADVAVYSCWSNADTEVYYDVEVAYSCDPASTGDTATALGTIDKSQLYINARGEYSAHRTTGRGYSQWLHPESEVRARYIFLRNASPSNNKYVTFIEVLSPVDCEYGNIVAAKNGETVTAFDGAGTYTVSVPVTEYVPGSADSYMIVAGYDASGVITAINCAPVTDIVDGKLSLDTIFNANTKTLKAVLIKNFTQPQMLTDALVLETPAQQ